MAFSVRDKSGISRAEDKGFRRGKVITVSIDTALLPVGSSNQDVRKQFRLDILKACSK